MFRFEDTFFSVRGFWGGGAGKKFACTQPFFLHRLFLFPFENRVKLAVEFALFPEKFLVTVTVM